MQTTKRGQRVITESGAAGVYVGTTPAGTVWIAYDVATYATMCGAFDKRYG